MRYLLLVHADETDATALSPDERERLLQEHRDFTRDLERSGAYVGSERLGGTETATTVRVRDGEALTTDGPFAETKECLGGYYAIDVPDLDHAIEWAAKCPTAKYGSVEIRPIREYRLVNPETDR